MKKKNLLLYNLDMKYVRNLQAADSNVLSVSPQISKSCRPFVGIIVICENKKYCVPLSSPKAKHAAMKNDKDFTRILDGEKIIGVLNFNEMIPVDDTVIRPVNLKTQKNDTPADMHYKK